MLGFLDPIYAIPSLIGVEVFDATGEVELVERMMEADEKVDDSNKGATASLFYHRTANTSVAKF
jgi:hypothetical protein